MGAGVGSGVAYGAAFVLHRAGLSVESISTGGTRIGIPAIREAIETVARAIEPTRVEGEFAAPWSASSEVLDALAMMLRDPVLDERLRDHLSEGAPAVQAIRGAFNEFARHLQALGGYFADRAEDLEQLADRVIRQLLGNPDEPSYPDQPFILVAETLSPIEASKLDPKRVLAVVTLGGSPTSHSSIITRAANLATVVGVVGAGVIRNGNKLLIDATSGQVFIEPTTEELRQYSAASIPSEKKQSEWAELNAGLPVKLYANLGSSFEGKAALNAGAQGVGLFRTELLYLGRNEPPSFDAQVFEYTKLLARFAGKRVIARVLDLDFDKPLPFLKPAGEGKYANRGLQVLLANPEVLDTQLAALAKAATYYPTTELWVMAPMVLNVEEAKQFVAMARKYEFTKVGVMIEVPEIAQRDVVEELVQHVDFLSIGTNDLTQYTLGKSRHTGEIAIKDVREQEVMDLIRNVVRAAKQASRPVGVCGEAAADPTSAKMFVDIGVDSLSASPALLPQLRLALLSSNMDF